MKILCAGALDLLKDPVQALQIQELTSATPSDGICLVASTIVITTCHKRYYRNSHPCPQDNMN